MNLRRLNTLRNRLLVLFFVITAAAVGFVYLYVVPQLESSLTSQRISRLQGQAALQAPRLQAALRSGLSPAKLEALLRRLAQASEASITVLGVRSQGGNPSPSFVVSDSRLQTGPQTGRFDVGLAAATGHSAAATETVNGVRRAEVALPIPAAHPVWIAVFSESLAEVESNVSLIRRQILIAGGIALGLAVLAGFWAARAISRRLNRLDEAAQKIAGGDFATPLPVDASDELGQLARTFNRMQRRLASLDSARKQFIANASHELRTPIFSLGGFVELLEDEDPDPAARAEFIRTMREQIERLTKLTTDLLDLSKLDADEMVIDAGEIDLGELAREVAREFGPAATGHGSQLELRNSPDVALATADPDRVRQIIRILLDNALTHTSAGTKVTVTTLGQNGRAQLIVSDEGGGIPARAQRRIFERFVTGDSGRGSGLGLAIARELAMRMQGNVSLVSERGFTAFTLTLPMGAKPRRASVREARA